MVQLVHNESEICYYGGCTDVVASNDCQIACPLGLQILSNVLPKVSGFTHALDVHIQFTLNDIIHNYHMLVIPLFE